MPSEEENLARTAEGRAAAELIVAVDEYRKGMAELLECLERVGRAAAVTRGAVVVESGPDLAAVLVGVSEYLRGRDDRLERLVTRLWPALRARPALRSGDKKPDARGRQLVQNLSTLPAVGSTGRKDSDGRATRWGVAHAP